MTCRRQGSGGRCEGGGVGDRDEEIGNRAGGGGGARDEPTAAQEIAAIIQQAEAAVRQVGNDPAARTTLREQLDQLAAWATAQEEPDGWRYQALAIHLRGLAMRLRGGA